MFKARSICIFSSPPMQRRFSAFPTFARSISIISANSFATSTEEPTMELRKLLRKFYKKVHPDLFASFPKQRGVNQNSLKELTSFTEEWVKNTAQSTYLPRRQTLIQFYLKKKKIDDGTPVVISSDDQESKDDTFTTHTMKLISNGSFSEIQAEYAKLFYEASLPTTFTVGGKSSEVAEFQFMDEFLSQHKETARDNVKKEEKASTVVKELLFKFKHHFDIKINTDSIFYNNFNFQNQTALENLYAALESIKKTDPKIIASLANTVIGLDSASVNYAVDYEQGRIYIDREGSIIDHVRHLRNLDFKQLKKGVDERGKHESDAESELKRTQTIVDKLKTQIGVKSIEMADESSFYSHDYQLDVDGMERLVYNHEREITAYHLFGKNIEGQLKVLARTWQKGKMKNVSILIRTLLDEKKFFITGEPSLIISPKVSGSEFLEIVKTQGPIVVSRVKELDDLQNTIYFILARMGLESLNIHFLIQSDPEGHRKVVSAVKKLEKVAGELRKFDLSGISIGIDNQYNVEPDGTLWIKWNFQMETLKKLMSKINEKKEQTKKEAPKIAKE